MSVYVRFFVIAAVVALAAFIPLAMLSHVLAGRAPDQGPDTLKLVAAHVAGVCFPVVPGLARFWHGALPLIHLDFGC